jgi:hypothetical protein
MLEGADHGPYLEHFGLFGLQTLDRADEVGAPEHFFARIDDTRAGSLVVRVPEMSLLAGSLFNQDRVAKTTDTGDGEGAQSGPVFVTVFFAGNSNDHRTGLLGAERSGDGMATISPGNAPCHQPKV